MSIDNPDLLLKQPLHLHIKIDKIFNLRGNYKDIQLTYYLLDTNL